MILRKFAQLRLVVLTISMLLIQFVAKAQIEVSVPFNDGFIGLIGSNTNQATNIQRFGALEIAKVQFVQTTNSGRFELTQGNDIKGILRLQLTNGRKVDIAGSLNWRVNSGSANQLFGFIADANISLNLSAYGGVNYSISGGSATGKSNFGFKLNNVAYTFPNNGQTVSGNAATGNTALQDLNAYLDAQPRVVAPAPANFLLNTPNQDPGDFVVANFAANDILLASVGLVNPPAGTSFSFGTTTGLTRSTGYSSWTGLTRISFTGTQADINAALASLLVGTGTSAGDIKLSVSATLNESGVFYNPVNGHYYKPVSGNITYANAKSGAAGQTFKGRPGYLVTITSQSEQDFVNSNTTQNNIWIALTDAASEGNWRIDAGPEAGTLIKTQNGQTAGNISGQYNNWCSGEPNNAGSSEHYAVTKWETGTCWNDLPGSFSSVQGYLVEFGTWTDPDDNAFLDFYSASTTYVANCPSNQAPVAPTVVSQGTNAGAGSVRLEVSVANGMTADWYASATGGSVLSGGQGVTTFNTPVITGTTTFYAQTRNATTGCLSATRTAVTATIVPCSTPNVRFKLSPPNVSTSAIQGQTGARTENFNSFTDGIVPASGTYAIGNFVKTGTNTRTEYKTDAFYGAPLPNSATLSRYLGVFSGNVVNVTLTEPSKYLGFWWAGGDDENQVTIFGTCGGNEIQLGQFTTSTVTTLLSGTTVTAIDGNSYNSSNYRRSNAGNSPFAYVNLELDDPNISFTRLEFTQRSGQGGFEVDNITTSTVYGAASSTTPGAPTITSISRGTGTATVNFTAPTSNGGQTITNYQYSTDGGTTWVAASPADIISPLVISGLNDATAYPIMIRAVNSIGSGAQSNSVNATVCTPPQVAAVNNQTVCNGAATTGITFSPPNSAGYQWMTLNSISNGSASGTGQNGITVSITQTGGGLAAQPNGMYDGTRFPGIYSVPTSGNQIRNTKAGVFTATFSQPVTNPLVAFASVGNPNLSVPVIVSAPFTPIWTNTADNYTTTYDLPNRTFTGREGYNIIRVDGTVSSVSFNYTVEEFYATMAFGFEDQNTTYTWTNDRPSIGLAASGTGNILPFNAINTGTTPVVATITVTPVTGGCAGAPRTFTITVNPSPIIAYSNSSYIVERTRAITSIQPTVTGIAASSFAITPALPTGLTFSTTNGTISGTPSVNSTSRTYTVSGTAASGCVGSTSFTLSVFSAVVPSALSYAPASQTVRQGTAITNMTPTASGGAVASYSISPALPAGLSFNTTTGIISGTLTAQQTGTVVYTITATNTGGSTTATVTLIFNTAPTDLALNTTSVAENTASGTTVGTLSATDSDAGDTFTYTLVSGTGSTDNASFTIAGSTLRTAAVFDFETKSSYSVRVRVTDAGGLTFEKAFTIGVTNVNEAPTNISASASSVAENAASGTTIATLSATDIDAGDTFTYTLVSGTGDTDNASFAITGSTLTTAAVFDFETKSSYSVRVRVTDAGGLSFEKVFTIGVTDVNDAPTNISATASSVAENAASGTSVATMSATDVDAGDTFTYTLVAGTGDTDNASFTIDGATLKTAGVFDFETKSSYSVRVRVTDAGGLTFEKVFTIGVTDVNEAPTALALSNTSVLENAASGTTVGTLAGTDADAGDTHTYTLVTGTGSTDNASFTITGTTLSTAAVFNFEAKNSYAVRVRVTDAGGLSFERAFTITVTDVNEAPTLTAITDRRVYNVSTSQVVTLAGITAGPETAQTTTTSVSTSNPAAFSAINVVGTQIQFTLAAGIATPQDVVVTVRVRDNGGVANGGVDSVVRTFRLGIDPMPVAAASPNLITLGATSQLSAAGANAVNYTWVAVGGTGIVGSGATINVRPAGTTTYAVVVTNSFGYQATVPVLLTVIVDYKLVPNNLVTPNGDGVNDRWVIPNIDMYPDNEVMVYDKAGRAVFAKRGYNNEWDGTVNGKKLKEDAYFYVIKFNKDGALPIRGYVSIVR